MVRQDWSGEGVGMVDIWRFTKTGNVLGVVEIFTRWVGQNAKLAIYTEVMHSYLQYTVL